MSPVGHSLIGLSFAAAAFPQSRDPRLQILLPISFVALANLPDWPIPNWGHDRYDISHSIFVNAALIGLVLSFWYSLSRFRSSVNLNCMLLGAGAWLSHLVLDSFYSHDRGIAIFWPFSEGRLNFPMPWFNTLDLSQSVVSRHNLSVYSIELAAYLPILVIVWVVRRIAISQPHAEPNTIAR